ncbi:MAG: hypothetical protein ABIR68_06710 [Ilumatobacteraceae bacterium]
MSARWYVASAVVLLAASVGSIVVATAAAPVEINGAAVAAKPAVRIRAAGPQLGGCPIYPTDNAWNTSVAAAPLASNSAAMIARIQAGGGRALHPDFGANQRYGIPYVVVPADQSLVPIAYDAYGDESDPGPFPIPTDAPVESGSDAHVLVLRQGMCDLFELFGARRSGGGWVAQSGARFDLTSNALRPLGWTSADAAGLPILPGLVRYDEVAAGHIDHAIRVTFAATRNAYLLPATHAASNDDDPDLPAMGQRLRLRAGVDLTGLRGQALVIATAMQRYGLIVADNGSSWYFQGGTDPRWNDDELDALTAIPGTDFDVVDSGAAHPG